ncbi:hypothetical protein [Corallococcus macrosporus]|uniref:Uncharacterized protein n=1 Tax=Corallococcus macrosporus DSM 14697 TaxID=1189310 RepID=A0A250JRM2_9BACT|nr:hypothetical protein [Corallococcus macrosporus]ATB46031.1 hypothetical protein MYMAC_001623 [Corallococcus macrosporus DSM 14697]
MPTREVCLLISGDGEVLWCDASDSPLQLPDSRARWEAIWRLRDVLEEVAHSHPEGPLGFSAEDESTMAALTSALGKPLRFSVVAPEGMVARRQGRDVLVADEPWWAEALRSASGIRHTPGGLA